VRTYAKLPEEYVWKAVPAASYSRIFNAKHGTRKCKYCCPFSKGFSDDLFTVLSWLDMQAENPVMKLLLVTGQFSSPR
jgi:hypothetical protein